MSKPKSIDASPRSSAVFSAFGAIALLATPIGCSDPVDDAPEPARASTSPTAAPTPTGPSLVTEIRGELTGSEPLTHRGSNYQDHRAVVQAGQTVRIDMMSSVLDSYLILKDGDGTILAENDDGGDGLNSRIEWTAPSRMELTLVASCYSGVSSGTYTITLHAIDGSQGSGIVPGHGTVPIARTTPTPTTVGTIPPTSSGDIHRRILGVLNTNDMAPGGVARDTYRFQSQAAQPLRLRVYSDMFQPTLRCRRSAESWGVVATSVGSVAQLSRDLPAAGVYEVEVSGGVGRYDLFVSTRLP